MMGRIYPLAGWGVRLYGGWEDSVVICQLLAVISKHLYDGVVTYILPW